MESLKFSFPYIQSRVGQYFDRFLRGTRRERSPFRDIWNTDIYDAPITKQIITTAEQNVRDEAVQFSRWKYDQICRRVFSEGTLLSNYKSRKARIFGGGLDITHNLTGQQAPKKIYNLIRKEWFHAILDIYLKHIFFGVNIAEFHLNEKNEIIIAYPVELGFVDTFNKSLRVPEDAASAKYRFTSDQEKIKSFNYAESDNYFEILENNNAFAIGECKQLARVISNKSLNQQFWLAFNKGALYQEYVLTTGRADAKAANHIWENLGDVPNARITRIGMNEKMEMFQHKDQQAYKSFEAYINHLNQEIGKSINAASLDGYEDSQASADEVKERSFNSSIALAREEFSLMIQDRLIPFLYRMRGGRNPYVRNKLSQYTITFKPAETNVTNEQIEQPDSIEKKSGDPNAL